jgi:hypothetical protein
MTHTQETMHLGEIREKLCLAGQLPATEPAGVLPHPEKCLPLSMPGSIGREDRGGYAARVGADNRAIGRWQGSRLKMARWAQRAGREQGKAPLSNRFFKGAAEGPKIDLRRGMADLGFGP